ncbi:hypothetical protein FYC62_06405 [Pedobacter aquae]|uniref:Uncharacterized protein n=1 Tax=Pedobacter aquae TaxID=2605747 RepID=A0A5C0VH21_9SPHI|nr:hypothetical protein [Pedobacter aquae]QEK51339.1 hypothetical protein FYC62_06405 [Pedobacter aquae]
MGMIFIYGLVFLLIFLSIGIGLFIYSIRISSKIGLTISVILILLVTLVSLTNTIDEFTISKNDIIIELKYLGIELKDDFEIKNNKVSGMPERIQETEVEITQKDKHRIISEITNSANFRSFDYRNELFSDGVVYNLKYPEFYSREILFILDDTPIRICVYIDENANIIKYQRIEE